MTRTRPEVTREDLASSLVMASRALLGVAIRSVNAASPVVTITQHRVLVLLGTQSQQSVGRLATQLGVDPSNATRLCDRLEKVHLLQRQRSADDRRAVTVSLTSAGRQLLEAVHAYRCAEVTRILDDVEEDQVAEMVAAMQIFTRAAELAQSGPRGSR